MQFLTFAYFTITPVLYCVNWEECINSKVVYFINYRLILINQPKIVNDHSMYDRMGKCIKHKVIAAISIAQDLPKTGCSDDWACKDTHWLFELRENSAAHSRHLYGSKAQLLQ